MFITDSKNFERVFVFMELDFVWGQTVKVDNGRGGKTLSFLLYFKGKFLRISHILFQTSSAVNTFVIKN